MKSMDIYASIVKRFRVAPRGHNDGRIVGRRPWTIFARIRLKQSAEEKKGVSPLYSIKAPLNIKLSGRHPGNRAQGSRP